MIDLLLASLLLAQAGAGPAPIALAGPTPEEDRLTVCLADARNDPATALAAASQWLAEADGAGRSYPHQCFGFAYMSLLRLDAAESAFLAARAARLESEHAGRARLAAMAGNAALAADRPAAALADFELAQADMASDEGERELAGTIAADRARALVALDRLGEAEAALAEARRDAPQSASVWLLSATLARRMEALAEAQALIQTAAALAPDDPAIGLEGGLIAALSGRDGAARRSWQSVIAAAPDSPEAVHAGAYLAQLDGSAVGR